MECLLVLSSINNLPSPHIDKIFFSENNREKERSVLGHLLSTLQERIRTATSEFNRGTNLKKSLSWLTSSNHEPGQIVQTASFKIL